MFLLVTKTCYRRKGRKCVLNVRSGAGEFRELHVGDDIVGFRKSWHDHVDFTMKH